MTKSKKKAARKAQRVEARSALMAVAPGLGTAQAAARLTGKVARKQSKKKGAHPFWSILAGAAKIAGELAPVVAPLLLAKHGPSAANLQAVGPAQAASSSGGGVPLASSASCATCTGVYGFKPKFGSDGRLNGIRMSGMDYLGALNVNSEVSGTQLAEIDLNPMSPDWAGTQAQRFASLFERFRPKRLAGLIEPSCPATTAGQVIAFIDPDADDDFSYLGRQAIQVASSHAGADVSQVWGMNVCGYGWDNRTQDYYADADGSDARLISPGTWRVLANTDMPATTALGSLYICWEYDFVIPQLEELPAGVGAYAFLEASTGTTAAIPLGTESWAETISEGSLSGQLAASGPAGAVSHIFGLSPGYYFIQLTIGYSGLASIPTISVDGTAYELADTPIGFTNNGSDLMGVFFVIQVHTRSTVPAEGYVALTWSSATTSPPAIAYIFAYPGGLGASGLKAKRTLQDYEREITRMRETQTLMMTRLDQLTANQTQSAALAAYSSLASTTSLTRR
jgi:hypothetical protein